MLVFCAVSLKSTSHVGMKAGKKSVSSATLIHHQKKVKNLVDPVKSG